MKTKESGCNGKNCCFDRNESVTAELCKSSHVRIYDPLHANDANDASPPPYLPLKKLIYSLYT